MDDITERYFQWICHIAMNGEAENYQRLLRFLYEKKYRYRYPIDANRESDGIDLRYRFGYLFDIPPAAITCELDNTQCSVLEMMVALALRCEENILRDFDAGDQTYKWFKNMIKSLGLLDQNDTAFNLYYTNMHLEMFMNGDYSWNGAGGLFYLRNPPGDMRYTDVWTQAMWWVDEQFNVT